MQRIVTVIFALFLLVGSIGYAVAQQMGPQGTGPMGQGMGSMPPQNAQTMMQMMGQMQGMMQQMQEMMKQCPGMVGAMPPATPPAK